jgi:hypothetical protein
LRRPACFQPTKDSVSRETESFSPFRNAKGFSVKCDSVVSTSIPRLRLHCRPPAILFRISGVVIDSIKRVLPGWSATDISEECFKAHFPLGGNPNPAAAVARVIFVVRIAAAIQHRTPGAVFRCARKAMRFISRTHLARAFCFQAAAAFSPPIRQFCTCHYCLMSTDTLAKPKRALRSGLIKTQNRQKVEGEPGQIFKVVRAVFHVKQISQTTFFCEGNVAWS